MGLFKSIGRWAKARAKEKSTLAGVSVLIAGAVAPRLGLPVGETAEILSTGIGLVLMAVTTKKETVPEDPG
jgi:hypothetical protein